MLPTIHGPNWTITEREIQKLMAETNQAQPYMTTSERETIGAQII